MPIINQYSIAEDPDFISLDEPVRPINVIQNGWTPQLANVTRTNLDGTTDVVQQVVDWFGGYGTKPQTGLYVGVDGLYEDIENAVAISGTDGTSTVYRYAVNNSGTTPPTITNVINPVGWTSSPTSIDVGEYRWRVQGVTLPSGQLLGSWTTPVIDGFVDVLSPEDSDDVFDI